MEITSFNSSININLSNTEFFLLLRTLQEFIPKCSDFQAHLLVNEISIKYEKLMIERTKN